MQFDVGKLGGAVDRHEHVELSLFGPHLCDVDVEEADRVGLELLLGLFLAVDVWQPADAVTLIAPVQRGACQMRDGWP